MVEKIFRDLSKSKKKEYFVEEEKVSALKYAFSKKEKSVKVDGITLTTCSKETSPEEEEISKLHYELRNQGYRSILVKWPNCIDIRVWKDDSENSELLSKYSFKLDWSNYEEEMSRLKEDYFSEKEIEL